MAMAIALTCGAYSIHDSVAGAGRAGSLGRVRVVPGDHPTVQAALAAAVDGDTILLEPGVHRGPVELDGKSVVLASRFLLTNDTSYVSRTVIDAGCIDDCRGNVDHAILARDVRFELTEIVGLTIRHADNCVDVYAWITVRNNLIHGCRDGIDFKNGFTTGGVVRQNVIRDNRDDGIDMDGTVDILVQENVILENGNSGIEIRKQPYAGEPLFYFIRGNTVRGNGGDGIVLIDYSQAGGPTDRVFVIESNVLHDNRLSGFGCIAQDRRREELVPAAIPEPVKLIGNDIGGNRVDVSCRSPFGESLAGQHGGLW